MRRAAGLLLALAFAGALRLDAAANYVVSGLVIDSRSHSVLANARVSLAPSAARDRKLEQVTRADGRFAFAVTDPGKYVLSMTKPGYPPQSYKQADFAAVSSAIVVRDGQDTSNLVFEARRGGVITGLVKDEDSEPVGNAQVAIFQSAIMGGERTIISRGQTAANAAGEFRFSGLPRGSYYICAMGRRFLARDPSRPATSHRPCNPSSHSSNSPGSGDTTAISSPVEGKWNLMRWACRKYLPSGGRPSTLAGAP